MPLNVKIAALHGHWIIADSIFQFLTVRLPSRGPKDPFDVIDIHSAFMRMRVWYSLLYVVLEGYRDVGQSDPTIDELLKQSEMVEGLRRFRNSTFHYQENPLSEKLGEFLVLEGSQKWIAALNKAFKAFFENHPDFKESFEAAKAMIAAKHNGQ